MDLDDLNELIAPARDTRPWVNLIRAMHCTNCGSENKMPAVLMREERPGHYVAAKSFPHSGATLREVHSPAYFARCEKCSGERPLKDAILAALAGATNDRDLAQRVGHILADLINRKRMGGVI